MSPIGADVKAVRMSFGIATIVLCLVMPCILFMMSFFGLGIVSLSARHQAAMMAMKGVGALSEGVVVYRISVQPCQDRP